MEKLTIENDLMIREEKIVQIPSMMQTGKADMENRLRQEKPISSHHK